MNEVQFMEDLESAIVRGSWPSTVGMVALDGCAHCSKILDCRDAVEVSAKATVLDGGKVAAKATDVMYCGKCYDKKILPMVESGQIRRAVALNLSRPLWAPPADPDTLPLPGVISEEQPDGAVRVTVQITDGRKIMGPEEEDNEPFPLPGNKEYVTWGGERYQVPTMGEVERWMFDGNCEAVDGCIVESDGRCQHGAPSWMVQLGMI